MQYFTPLYRELADHVDALEVLYLRDVAGKGAEVADPGFGRSVRWDIDLTSGYEWSSAGIANAPFEYSTGDYVQIVTQTRTWIKRFRPDVVLVPGWVPAYCLVAATVRACGVPVIARPEARAPAGPRVRRILRDLAARTFVRQASAFAIIGTLSRDELRRLGAADEACFASPYTVDDRWWRLQAIEATALRDTTRAEWGVSESTTVFLAVGKMAPYKKPLLLVDLFAAVHRRRPNTHLCIVGDGELTDTTRERIAELQIQDAVSLLGFHNQGELPAVYGAADVFVLVSQETWGLVANEAMAFGLPLAISVDAGCSRDLVVDGVTGFRLNLADRLETISRLTSLADDPNRKGMSRAVVRAAGNYTLHNAALGICRAADYAVGTAKHASTEPDDRT